MSATDPGGLVGFRDVVLDHGRRLNDLEGRERRTSEELAQLRLTLEAIGHTMSSRIEKCEAPLKRFNRIAMTFLCAFAILAAGAIWKMFSERIAPAPIVTNHSERLEGSDPRPTPPHRGENEQ